MARWSRVRGNCARRSRAHARRRSKASPTSSTRRLRAKVWRGPTSLGSRPFKWPRCGKRRFEHARRAARADDADLGREVYDDFCVTCHGRDMVNPGGVTFDLRKFPKDDFERFRNAVLDGKPPAMPPWRDKISDDDLKVLWAYVRSGG